MGAGEMNRRQVGRTFEYWCKDFLEKQGYSVHLCGKKALRMKDQKTGEMKLYFKGDDIFGCDGIAVIKGKPILFFQATTHTDMVAKLKQVMVTEIPPEHAMVEVWQKIESGRVVIHRLEGDVLKRNREIQRGKELFYDTPQTKILSNVRI